MTVWTFLCVLNNVLSKEKLVTVDHNVSGTLLIAELPKILLWVC